MNLLLVGIEIIASKLINAVVDSVTNTSSNQPSVNSESNENFDEFLNNEMAQEDSCFQVKADLPTNNNPIENNNDQKMLNNHNKFLKNNEKHPLENIENAKRKNLSTKVKQKSDKIQEKKKIQNMKNYQKKMKK